MPTCTVRFAWLTTSTRRLPSPTGPKQRVVFGDRAFDRHLLHHATRPVRLYSRASRGRRATRRSGCSAEPMMKRKSPGSPGLFHGSARERVSRGGRQSAAALEGLRHVRAHPGGIPDAPVHGDVDARRQALHRAGADVEPASELQRAGLSAGQHDGLLNRRQHLAVATMVSVPGDQHARPPREMGRAAVRGRRDVQLSCAGLESR